MVKELDLHKGDPFIQTKISSNGTSERYFKGIIANCELQSWFVDKCSPFRLSFRFSLDPITENFLEIYSRDMTPFCFRFIASLEGLDQKFQHQLFSRD